MFGLFMTSEIRKRNTDWEIIADGTVSQEQMVFNGFMVVPGGSDDYTLKVTPVASVYADLIIDFEEMENSVNTPLKDLARVSISIKGEQVVDKLFSELFEGDAYKTVIKVVEGVAFKLHLPRHKTETIVGVGAVGFVIGSLI
jgi:hypothetical protein